MAIDHRTPRYLLPLPHPLNLLQDDVSRLRDAIAQIDGLLFLINTTLATNDPAMDSLQEVVNAIKAATFDLIRMVPAASSTLTYNGAGLLTEIADVLPGGTTRTITYTYQAGKVATETLVCDGVTHFTGYTYSGERIASIARSIVP